MNLYESIESSIRVHAETLRVTNSPQELHIRHAIRWVMRDNPDIFWWYKQNMMVVAKDKLISTILSQTSLLELIKVKNLIHPELYDIKCKLADFYKNKADLAYEGRLPLKEYLKMLKKWIWTKKEK